MDMQEEKLNKLREAALRVLAFFDVFDFPPTALELWRFSDYQCDFAEFLAFLNENGDFWEKKDEFYFGQGKLIPDHTKSQELFYLVGREALCAKRKERADFALDKKKKALRVARLFRFIPWIKMIAIGNVIGQDNMKAESDIDIFIITESKRIWITRFITVALIKILGLRPELNNVQDKICLSFFVSADNLNLQNLMIDNDIYFYFWLANLEPIYDQADFYHRLIQSNNWLLAKMPNWSENTSAKKFLSKNNNAFFYRDILDLFLGGLDGSLKKYQLKVMAPILKDLMNKDTRVVINDGVLKLISNDRREHYRNLYLDRLASLNKDID
jgi:hypothetical protein